MNRNPAAIFTLIALLIVLALAGLTWFNYQFSAQNPGGNDFLARWMGANMWLKEGFSPYDEAVSLATQEMIYGHPADPSIGEDKNHFVYPMYSMVFFGPFGLLDYNLARALWMTLTEVALVATVFVGLRLADWRPSLPVTALLVLFALLWYHGARTVVIGQFAGVNALLITLSIYWIKEKQDTAAGVLLALSTSKPQMVFLLVPFVLIWAFSNRRTRVLTGFFITFAALLAVSLMLLPSWPLEMLRQVMDYPNYTNIGSPLSILAGYAPGIEPFLNRLLHTVAYLYLVVQWALAWKKDERWFVWTAWMTIVVTNLVAVRTATTNYVVLLPVLLLVFRVLQQRWKGAGVAINVAIAAGLLGGLWALFLRTVEGNIESAIMYLPLPLLSLVTLWWVRWWAVRRPHLLLEEVASRFG